jgi:hypothetical protein
MLGTTDFYTLNYVLACEFKERPNETYTAAKADAGTLKVIGAEFASETPDSKGVIHRFLEVNRYTI